MTKRVVWIICAALAIVGCIAAATQLLFPSRFDPVRWQSADSPQQYLGRREMMPRLQKLLAEGAIDSRQTALRQLGHPQRGDDTADAWFYDLGTAAAGGSFATHDWLELRFDANDRVVTHRVVQE